MSAQSYRAKKQTYLTKDKKSTRTVYHPQAMFRGELCHFPDETTESGLIEYDNKEDALVNAIELYKHYKDK
ncbi:hypothetical protein [Paenibacillus antarcticus]|uniref:Uncharacterized protein n=1 Tax=Paenibacillus antarcticus TaxID=253703 RepID=A0A162MGN5_9BACL|nr:hypothetical protein [Paenibacillus antarcticus]OAB48485.1 hypothetical protein PBAT_02300 [Paenibacillus antarcticus]